MPDTLAPQTATVPQYTQAQARRDFAHRTAERYRAPIREAWQSGLRLPGELAAALNGRGILASTGRPWVAASMARTLKLLRFDRHADAQRDAAALEELLEELWRRGYRVPLHLGVVLSRLEVLCPWGGSWSARKATLLLQHHVGEWMTEDASVRLRHGNDALKLEEFPELPAIGRTPTMRPSAPEPANLGPCEPVPRRRGIRIS